MGSCWVSMVLRDELLHLHLLVISSPFVVPCTVLTSHEPFDDMQAIADTVSPLTNSSYVLGGILQNHIFLNRQLLYQLCFIYKDEHIFLMH